MKMSEDSEHDGATTIRASKSTGGAGKWLLGAVGAVVVLGGGYLAWKNFGSSQTNIDSAYNDAYLDSEPLRATPLERDDNMIGEDAATDETVAAPASATPRSTPARTQRRAPAADGAIPEATIGITPINATTTADSEEVYVTAPRRPVWTRTPSERRLSALYPTRALERGNEGEARLRCTVQESGALDCVRVEETPGFGNAALRVARTFRHAPTLADGGDAVGTPVNMRVVFRIDDGERRG
jgi:TonB family protein